MQVSYNNALHPALQRVQQLVNQIGWQHDVEEEDLYVEVSINETSKFNETFQVVIAAESPKIVLVGFISESILLEPEDVAGWALTFLAENQDYVYGHWIMDSDEDGYFCAFQHNINMQHTERYELELLLATMGAAVSDFRTSLWDQRKKRR